MKKMIHTLAVAMVIFIAIMMISAASEQSSNEKIPVIIGFKDKPDAALVNAHGGEIKYQYNNIPAIAVNLPEEAINALKNNPKVAYIEEDAEVHILVDNPITPWVEDDDIETPWGVDRIDAEEAHLAGFTGKGVNVSIIDTGIDYTHIELAANYVGGYNFVREFKTPMDDNGHGTHVAGTIAALDNDIGVVGVAPEANLYALKALDKSGSGYVSDINAAIDWSIDNNMDVISMSLGGGYSDSQEAACQAAYDAGIVIVAAAGNEGTTTVSYPAAYDSVIAVSATTSMDDIASFSNTGSQIELAAPGSAILSTYPDDYLATMSGTSMATPHVSGVVALLLGSNFDPNGDGIVTPSEVREHLKTTADDSMLTSGEEHDNSYGYGIVNAIYALDGLGLPDGSSDPGAGDNVGDNGDLSSSVVVSDPVVKAGGKFVWATATVTVVDSNGDGVEGVAVEGIWTIVVDGISYPYTMTGTTDYSGEVVFKSETYRYPDTYDFTNFELTVP